REYIKTEFAGIEASFETLKIALEKKIANTKDGVDYVLTEADKQEIASKINVPIVEKITHTIVKEQPIVTEITKEVALTDTADDIRNKLELLPAEDEDGEDQRLDASAIKALEDL